MTITVHGTPAPQGRDRGLGNSLVDGRFLPRHGHYGTPEYMAWVSMKKRCLSVGNASYANYGGRGIRVCGRWAADFVAFLSDVGSRPSAKHSIGRINNDGNYEPANVRWETAKQQQSNRRSVRLLTLNGTALPLSDWSQRCGVPRSTLLQRIKAGWSVERAITTSPDKRRASK